jgi:hypothetical protein
MTRDAPTVPTPPPGDKGGSILNTKWVNNAINTAITNALTRIIAALNDKLDKVTNADQSVVSNVTFQGNVSLP